MLIGCVYLPPSALATTEQIDACYSQLATDVERFAQCGEVVIMGDLNSRVGSASADNQHIGRWGEQTANPAGIALIDFLRNTNLYTLNNRLPCPAADSHTPAYTRARLTTTGQDDADAQRSIIDYVLMPAKYVFAEPHQVRPPCTLQVETSHKLSRSDHRLLWFTLPHPVQRSTPPTFSQARPNTYKLTLPKSALTAEDWSQREAYPEALEEQFGDFSALLTQLKADVDAGTIQAREACQKAKDSMCDRINAAVDATIGFGRPRRHPSNRVPFVRTRAVKDAVKDRDLAAATLLDINTTDPLNTDAIATAQAQVKEAQASLKAAVDEARQGYTNRLIAEVDSCRRGNDGKGMWKALKALGGSQEGKRTGPAALRNPDGPGLVTDAQGTAFSLLLPQWVA